MKQEFHLISLFTNLICIYYINVPDCGFIFQWISLWVYLFIYLFFFVSLTLAFVPTNKYNLHI